MDIVQREVEQYYQERNFDNFVNVREYKEDDVRRDEDVENRDEKEYFEELKRDTY